VAALLRAALVRSSGTCITAQARWRCVGLGVTKLQAAHRLSAAARTKRTLRLALHRAPRSYTTQPSPHLVNQTERCLQTARFFYLSSIAYPLLDRRSAAACADARRPSAPAGCVLARVADICGVWGAFPSSLRRQAVGSPHMDLPVYQQTTTMNGVRLRAADVQVAADRQTVLSR